MRAEIGYRWVPGGLVARGYVQDVSGLVVPHEAFVPGEVGRFGSRLRRGLKKLGRSKVLRGIARTATNLAKQTPYGRAASAAVRVARGATRAARRGGSSRSRARPLSRAAARSRTSAVRRGAAMVPADTQVRLVRALLGTPGMGRRARLAAIKAVVSS